MKHIASRLAVGLLTTASAHAASIAINFAENDTNQALTSGTGQGPTGIISTN